MAIKHTFRENVLRVVAVVGLIAVLLLGAWGIIQLAFLIPSFVSNVGTFGKSADKETMTVSVPAAITSGNAFPISWTHKNGSGAHSYTISYSCADGVALKAPLPTGAAQAVACNTPFNYVNASTSMPLIVTLAGKEAKPVTFTVSATKLGSGAVAISGTSNTTVHPDAAAKPAATKPAATKPAAKPAGTTYVPSGRTQNLYGYPDLAVYVTKAPQNVRAGQRVSIQFAVQNTGTNVTPQNWSFTATLPYTPVYTHYSGGQQALYPGDKIVYTLTYDVQPNYGAYGTTGYVDPAYTGWSYPYSYVQTDYQYQYPSAYPYQQSYGQPQTVSIQVDPNNFIWELSETNNSTQVTYPVY